MNPVYVALDTTDPDYARSVAERVRMSVGGLKLGLEFFNAHGPDGMRPFLDMGLPVFLDLKYHDIPNTVAGAAPGAASPRVSIPHVQRHGWGARPAPPHPSASPSSMSMPRAAAR